MTETHAPAAVREIDALLARTLEMKGSDLHLAAGKPPWVSRHGSVTPMEGITNVLSGAQLVSLFKPMVAESEWKRYLAKKRLDFSYAIPQSRFRAHFAVAGGQPMAVFRTIPNTVPDYDDLGLPPVLKKLIHLEAGIIPFVGVTGSGKSSSLAALIKLAKNEFNKKIITIENPIEFRHTDAKSLIIQREIGPDVDNFALGIEDAMREAPDIIVVGEMRDPETMMAAISAATSGHLVLTTIHAESTADVPTRILDSMPESRVADVRAQLSRSLKAAVYQKLLPKKGGEGRVLAAEVMMMNSAIANMIRQNDLEGIASQLMVKSSGSIPFEVSLVNLVADGIVNESAALRAELTPGSYMRQKAAGRR
ncbi:type IV pilus twitching motility protein PilT [Arthrobacter caoxuetaonis]|uniref:PilT/PilU family type 4a pilus ATPase n=1 Tax=Arthrobacter caoxuetaonis TaxID=2886935 RepID=A0A9X1SGD0_9MICC|nr:PilT/PilU family type 4a pilus ATPase [Arthrobacter caoxuetaonis]MCC3299249.1 PilT/PilU family type 4a pilus ATPase [Arthrobacter caoxuetaonis]USQ59257.1 PilT/PilU family type 4a pilus ATPase [Arthrobacter caoxuetaonis]